MPAKRELIEPHKGDKRYVRGNTEGQFKESDDVDRSLAADRRQKAKTIAKPGPPKKASETHTALKRVWPHSGGLSSRRAGAETTQAPDTADEFETALAALEYSAVSVG